MSEHPIGDLDKEILAAISDASLQIANQVELDRVLAGIVEAARTLVDARYAALGVAGPTGDLTTFIHSGMDEETVAQMPHLPKGRGLSGRHHQRSNQFTYREN